jgi:hypothetical protein
MIMIKQTEEDRKRKRFDRTFKDDNRERDDF